MRAQFYTSCVLYTKYRHFIVKHRRCDNLPRLFIVYCWCSSYSDARKWSTAVLTSLQFGIVSCSCCWQRKWGALDVQQRLQLVKASNYRRSYLSWYFCLLVRRCGCLSLHIAPPAWKVVQFNSSPRDLDRPRDHTPDYLRNPGHAHWHDQINYSSFLALILPTNISLLRTAIQADQQSTSDTNGSHLWKSLTVWKSVPMQNQYLCKFFST